MSFKSTSFGLENIMNDHVFIYFTDTEHMLQILNVWYDMIHVFIQKLLNILTVEMLYDKKYLA